MLVCHSTREVEVYLRAICHGNPVEVIPERMKVQRAEAERLKAQRAEGSGKKRKREDDREDGDDESDDESDDDDDDDDKKEEEKGDLVGKDGVAGLPSDLRSHCTNRSDTHKLDREWQSWRLHDIIVDEFDTVVVDGDGEANGDKASGRAVASGGDGSAERAAATANGSATGVAAAGAPAAPATAAAAQPPKLSVEEVNELSMLRTDNARLREENARLREMLAATQAELAAKYSMKKSVLAHPRDRRLPQIIAALPTSMRERYRPARTGSNKVRKFLLRDGAGNEILAAVGVDGTGGKHYMYESTGEVPGAPPIFCSNMKLVEAYMHELVAGTPHEVMQEQFTRKKPSAPPRRPALKSSKGASKAKPRMEGLAEIETPDGLREAAGKMNSAQPRWPPGFTGFSYWEEEPMRLMEDGRYIKPYVMVGWVVPSNEGATAGVGGTAGRQTIDANATGEAKDGHDRPSPPPGAVMVKRLVAVAVETEAKDRHYTYEQVDDFGGFLSPLPTAGVNYRMVSMWLDHVLTWRVDEMHPPFQFESVGVSARRDEEEQVGAIRERKKPQLFAKEPEKAQHKPTRQAKQLDKANKDFAPNEGEGSGMPPFVVQRMMKGVRLVLGHAWWDDAVTAGSVPSHKPTRGDAAMEEAPWVAKMLPTRHLITRDRFGQRTGMARSTGVYDPSKGIGIGGALQAKLKEEGTANGDAPSNGCVVAGKGKDAKHGKGDSSSGNKRVVQPPTFSPQECVIRGRRGFRTSICTQGCSDGDRYFEVHMRKLGATGHARVGWALPSADKSMPIGTDAYGYGYRDIDGAKMHEGEVYGRSLSLTSPQGRVIAAAGGGPPEGFSEGDVVGCRICFTEGDVADEPGEGEGRSRSSTAEIRFYRNGVLDGVFSSVDAMGRTFFPAVSLYTRGGERDAEVAECEVNLGENGWASPPADAGEDMCGIVLSLAGAFPLLLEPAPLGD